MINDQIDTSDIGEKVAETIEVPIHWLVAKYSMAHFCVEIANVHIDLAQQKSRFAKLHQAIAQCCKWKKKVAK